MSAPQIHPPSIDHDTQTIEHLDFAPPCGYRPHEHCGDGPASLAVWLTPTGPSCPCPNRPFCDCGAVEGAWSSILRVERIS